jgi:hypothetical protein
MNKRFLLIPLCVSLLSCATSRKPFDPAECNEQGGYERGFVEGKNGRDPDTDYVTRCREDLRPPVRKGYQRGYDKGRVEYKEMLAKMEKEQREQDAADNPPPEPPQPSFFCSIQWHGRGFEASGFTLDEARTKVVDQCAQSMSRAICGPLPVCKNEPPHANPRAFYCSIEVFTHKYEAYGPTMTETRSNLAQTCEAKENSDFFCKEDKMKCKRNK